METNFENVLNLVSEKVKGLANTETVIGEEFKMGEYTCKPVIKVGVGFGSGTGSGKQKGQDGSGTGAGAGVGISPVGFLATKGDEISFISTSKSGLSNLFEKMPEMMEKAMEFKKGKAKS